MADVFISYAWDDDAIPPGVPGAKGFVTLIGEGLQYEFKDLGPERPTIWRDDKGIAQAEQITPAIEEALKSSSFLLVVLSPNWMAREWCRNELEAFARYHDAGGGDVRERIIVVGKRHVDPDRRPSYLQGQRGFAFYEVARDAGEIDGEIEYFSHGGIRDDKKYWSQLKSLAEYLRRLTKRPARKERPPAEPAAHPSGRTIYLATPAWDMRAPYNRLANELRGRGHTVVPDPDKDIPLDASTTATIDSALKEAEISIHLLGEKVGPPAPDHQQPIVKLQLERAGVQAAAAEHAGFHRLIWAPKLLPAAGGAENGAKSAGGAAERDPIGVLVRFHRQLPTDKIEGDSLSRFVDFLNEHLIKITPPRPSVPLAPAGGGDTRIYLCHSDKDERYAGALAEALRQRHIEAMLPALKGRDAETFNDQLLAECDAVAVCWASEEENWVRAQAYRLRDWRGLRRTRQFIFRAVILGPPPVGRKKIAKLLCPPSVIDLIVDLTDEAAPTPEHLDPLVPAARPTS